MTPPLPLRVEPAVASDLAAVRRLLDFAELPDAGVETAFPDGYCVARDGDTLVAVAGLEAHGRVGLLRSVAVTRTHRGHALARRLVDDRMAHARALGLQAVYLLTARAGDYFRRLGFCDATRAEAPADLRRSLEFSSLCPASPTCLAKIVR
ncbi:MAG: arsenic resistance N-acetyltransferase ArsN2 [Polyangiaceae bacterium]